MDNTMTLYIDRKYVLLVAPQLENFKQKGPYLFNFRCPICGDSQKNKLKSRGYFYRQKNSMFFKCHNCHVPMSVGTFLKTINHDLYDEYKLELFKESGKATTIPTPNYDEYKMKPTFKNTIDLPSIRDLPEDHFARQYIAGRNIPQEKWTDIFFAEDFAAFIKETFPNCDKDLKVNEQRIVLPFYDEKNILQGVQGRVLDDSKIRYITIRAHEDMKKVYGLNKIDFSKPITVVEGPIDSMFLDNCIATMDSALYRIVSILGDHDYVFVYDNQPRNKDIVKMVRKAAVNGAKVVIFPTALEAKDINDMVLDGVDVKALIQKHTYQGPRALLEFQMWSKV